MQDRFEPYSLLHLAAVLFFFALMAGVLRLGLLMRRRGEGDRYLRRLISAAIVIYYLWYMPFEARPATFDIQRSLPLHFCDFAWAPCLVALLRPSRIARALAYYWGILLSGQAFIQPILVFPPTSIYFWTFFFGHTLIVGSALYILIIDRYRPTLRDFAMALGISIGVLAVLFVINMILGTNYGYVGRSTPENPTVIDLLGAWPLRVVWMVLIGSAIYFAAYIIWPLSDLLRGRRR